MSIFYTKSAPELATGMQYDTLRFHLEPTRIGRWFGYEPVTREYLTNGGIHWFDSQGGMIDEAWEWNSLNCVYQSEKMKLKIERNRPLNITVIDTGARARNPIVGQTNPGPQWEVVDEPNLGGRVYYRKESDQPPTTPAAPQ